MALLVVNVRSVQRLLTDLMLSMVCVGRFFVRFALVKVLPLISEYQRDHDDVVGDRCPVSSATVN